MLWSWSSTRVDDTPWWKKREQIIRTQKLCLGLTQYWLVYHNKITFLFLISHSIIIFFLFLFLVAPIVSESKSVCVGGCLKYWIYHQDANVNIHLNLDYSFISHLVHLRNETLLISRLCSKSWVLTGILNNFKCEKHVTILNMLFLPFFVQAKEENELPEYILGTVRLNQVRLESAVPHWGECWTKSDAVFPGNRNILFFSICIVFHENVISAHGCTYSNRRKWLISYFMVWYDSNECSSLHVSLLEKT